MSALGDFLENQSLLGLEPGSTRDQVVDAFGLPSAWSEDVPRESAMVWRYQSLQVYFERPGDKSVSELRVLCSADRKAALPEQLIHLTDIHFAFSSYEKAKQTIESLGYQTEQSTTGLVAADAGLALIVRPFFQIAFSRAILYDRHEYLVSYGLRKIPDHRKHRERIRILD